jgi:hypothetical protein
MKRDVDRKAVIALAKKLGLRGMPGATRYKQANGGMFASKITAYKIGEIHGASDGGNGDWGDQSSHPTTTQIFIDRSGKFWHTTFLKGGIWGPMNEGALEGSSGTRGGYQPAFDFEAALVALRSWG